MRASPPNDLTSYDVFSDTIAILLSFSIFCQDLLGEDENVSQSKRPITIDNFTSSFLDQIIDILDGYQLG